jgi:hypothetical protein
LEWGFWISDLMECFILKSKISIIELISNAAPDSSARSRMLARPNPLRDVFKAMA